MTTHTTNTKVSVIMPCYNSEKYIKEAIESVLSQSHQNLELLICDDGSSDRSADVISDCMKSDKRIKYFANVNQKGAAGARNTCLDNATGDFISFLDSDDLWLPKKLENQIQFMLDNDFPFVYSYNHVVDEHGRFLRTYKCPGRVTLNSLCFSNFLSCSTVMYDCRRIGKIYQPNIRKRNDFALWLKILKDTEISVAYCYSEPTSIYRENTYGLSSNRLDAIKYYFRCLIVYAGRSRLSALFYVSVYLMIVLVKKKMPMLYNVLVRYI